uniref:Vacuolar protein sorting-associated protein 52 homolog n=1 Tax=Ciona intestinalis TaxID=7719 RepID=F7AD97_CIOIN|nr:vacuolar protein sorting-associated protein 52 homolog [Ciona intestinalis]|eukprot:XP_002124423.1 vacuolar protein sorting-associated protein 52 homolog [Ciona intestinalis]
MNEAEALDFAINLENFDLSSEDALDNVDEHIQENLEDDLVKKALESGVDLREYAKQIEQDLQAVENTSIADYVTESVNIARLHTRIGECDGILERMESMLHGFQHDLSSISAEIQCLQEQSVLMNIKLKNRQAVKSELSQLVDEMAVPELMINQILDCPVTERAFLEQLHELNHKINFIKQHSYNETAACRDVQDVTEKLKFKAIAKIREFLLTKIYSFRKPMSNYQLGQDAMLKNRFFYEFLLSNERHVAREVRDEYVDTLSKVYLSYFKTYVNRIMKLQFEESAGREDLMATEDSSRKGFFSSSKPAMRNRSTVFTLGKRDEILKEKLESPIIVPHAAQKSESKHSFESLFRSQHYALLDTCCREYLFLCDFFMLSSSAAQDLFNAILGKTLALFLKHVDTHCSECHDAIALFLCIHIVYKYQVIMTSRDVTSLDNYWDTVKAILWPRFEHLVKMHTRSIVDCNVHNLSSIDIRPHYITRRYAEFSAAVVRINENYPNPKVEQVLSQLQTEVQNFILRLAACFSDRKDQLVFLINNYDMMLSVLMEKTTEDSKESESFQQLLNSRTQEYVEEILAPHFGGMMAFVKDCEVVLESGQTDRLKVFEQKVVPLVQGFAAGWRTSVDLISREVTRSFTNFKVGSTIVQAAFTHLIQYYHRFQKLFTQHPFKTMPAKSDLVNMHLIMVEMKKYKPNF